jgi:adenylate cyclase
MKPLLQTLIRTITRTLDAERSTLLINDEKTNQLYAEFGEGLGTTEIRLPNSAGIAGTVFTTGRSLNIPYAYADPRFNTSFDRKTGFFTRSILCVAVVDRQGRALGVTQVLNKRGGEFTTADEGCLRSFSSEIAAVLEYTKRFDDVQEMKDYNDCILNSMPCAVMTVNEGGVILSCNRAGLRIMGVEPDEILQRRVTDFFVGRNHWVVERMLRLGERPDDMPTGATMEFGGELMSVNVTIAPLVRSGGRRIGSMIMLEDVRTVTRIE